ncbi:gluconokinase [Dietzia sp. SYD-A1]|uniref:gluconokinase n=1 Tax=Dietzia sp. SYD-A1 TaxID=2780141 RepID=UPI001891E9A8|nr:gluconokinase [Dietzia sp. SYD-A1]
MTHIVVMGVTGAGKSTVAQAIAERIGAPFVDADDLHPPANRRKLGAGEPLTDLDREPWLEAVRTRMAEQSRFTSGSGRDPAPETTAGPGLVVACSALRRAYRDILRGVDRPVFFVELRGDRKLLAARLAARGGHFASPQILDSQLATVEPLAPDEHGITCPVSGTVEQVADTVVAALRPDRRR